MAHRSGMHAAPVRKSIAAAQCLCIIFYYNKVVSLRQLQQGLHIGRLTEQVYRYNSTGTGRNRLFCCCNADIKCIGIYIYKYRFQAQ
ncbi:hypothetical protein D3C87_1791020 [compost metagenome]